MTQKRVQDLPPNEAVLSLVRVRSSSALRDDSLPSVAPLGNEIVRSVFAMSSSGASPDKCMPELVEDRSPILIYGTMAEMNDVAHIVLIVSFYNSMLEPNKTLTFKKGTNEVNPRDTQL